MTNHLPLVSAIQWYEGMLLSPQHFQQLELRWQQTTAIHLTHLSAYHWGIIDLVYDPVALPAGIFRILELKAVMQDGSIIDYRAKPSGHQLEIDLKPLKKMPEIAHTVIHLCVPIRVVGSSPINGDWPVYESVDGGDVADDNAADNIIQIPRLIPKFSLYMGNNLPPQHQTLPLVRIGVQDESFVTKTYMPPCFFVTQLTPLGEKCGKLVSRIREKTAFLSERWQSLIGTPLLAESSAQLRPLVQVLPLIEPLVTSGKAHPYEMYHNLCHVAGLLSTLRLGQIPPLFPVYDHNEILDSTASLLDWCQNIIDSLEKSYSLVLFARRDNLFSVMLQQEIFTKSILIGLKAPSNMSEKELEEWMSDAIIVSESMLESVQMRRMTGAARHIIGNPDLYDLMPGRGVLIFRVETDPHFIKPDERLVVVNLADHENKRPTEVILYLKHNEISGDVIDHLEDES